MICLLVLGYLNQQLVAFDDGFILVLHPFQETRRRKDELQFVVGQFGVLLRRRALTDEFGQVTLVRNELSRFRSG